MTFTRIVGASQERAWITHSAADRKLIERAKALIRTESFDEARSALEPLIAAENAEALYLAAGFSLAGESAEDFDRRFLQMMARSAAGGFAPALYVMGFLYDTGELVAPDSEKAADFFKEAALKKHAHSQWLYGLRLLYGTGGATRDEARGLSELRESAAAGFQGALETLARFHETGEFGFPVNPQEAAALRTRAKALDSIGYLSGAEFRTKKNVEPRRPHSGRAQ
jgi:TPR repeat protein